MSILGFSSFLFLFPQYSWEYPICKLPRYHSWRSPQCFIRCLGALLGSCHTSLNCKYWTMLFLLNKKFWCLGQGLMM